MNKVTKAINPESSGRRPVSLVESLGVSREKISTKMQNALQWLWDAPLKSHLHASISQ
jgi:hypothetical protein